MKCLRKQKFTPFPILDKQSKIPKIVCTEKIDVFDARYNAKTVTNGSISNVLVFSHFPTVMTNGHALLVCETEIFIQPFSFPFP